MSATLCDLIGTDQIAGNPTSQSVPSIYRGPEHRSVRFSVPKLRFLVLNAADGMSPDRPVAAHDLLLVVRLKYIVVYLSQALEAIISEAPLATRKYDPRSLS